MLKEFYRYHKIQNKGIDEFDDESKFAIRNAKAKKNQAWQDAGRVNKSHE